MILYYIFSIIYLNLIIRPFSFIVNMFYRIIYSGKSNYSITDFYKRCEEINSIEGSLIYQREIIEEYSYDFFQGALNWFADLDVILLRSAYDDKKHSMDCKEHALLLKEIIRHSKLKDSYLELKEIVFLSIDPLVRGNHTMLIAYRHDRRIDIFSPYKYLCTVPYSMKNELYKICEKWSKYKYKYYSKPIFL